MGKYCEVGGCDRAVRTGRKYCFEHRNASNSNIDRKIEKINEKYLEYCQSFLYNKSFLNIDGLNISGDEVEKEVIKQIKNKDTRYIDFVKKYVKREKEERDFKKSLLK